MSSIAWKRIVSLIGLISALVLFAAVLGNRNNAWDFLPTGYYVTLGAFGLALLSVTLALALLLVAMRRSTFITVKGVLLSVLPALLVAAPISVVTMVAQELPSIHNISTDTEDPPAFTATIKAIRVATLGTNKLTYKHYEGYKHSPGPTKDLAQTQRDAYPDIKPITTRLPPDRAYGRALELVRSFNWMLISANPNTRVIEATDKSLWFGFKDDVVIRIRADDRGSRVDLRSASRIGRSDLGVNAKRIGKFINTW